MYRRQKNVHPKINNKPSTKNLFLKTIHQTTPYQDATVTVSRMIWRIESQIT